MALVTVQRSPSPSTEHDLDTVSSDDTTDGKSHLKKRLKTSKEKLRKVLSSVRFLSKLRPGLSESYFTFKGAALILPHSELTNRKSSKKTHGGEIQDHLQAMLLLLRPEEQVKIAVRLEDVPNSVYKRYITVVATRGRQDTEEAVILGMDCRHGEAVIGLVLPVWLGLKIQLEGDGSFRLCTDEQAYLFNPVSVQAMWSAIQSLVKVLHKAEEMKYIHDGLTHTWVEYYRSRIDHNHVSRNHHWSIEGVQVFAPSILLEEDESVKIKISNTLKDVMLSVDLDETTCRDLRLAVEENLGFSVKEHKTFFDEEMIRIFGQMDAPSKILDYLYLGSEWNASNLDELKSIGIGYILNVTKEIDNFYTGNFHYFTVRVYDVEESDLLKHWDKTFKFISKARAIGSKVLVHCKMGISRSGSTVMAYLMKENRWSVDEAFKFVKERRSVVSPNKGFMEQLHMYEAILSASNKRDIFRTKASDGQTEEGLKDGLDQDQDSVLGDSMMNVMAEDWMMMMMSQANDQVNMSSLEENLEQLHYGPRLVPDLEGTESRSGDSLEESLPDIPSPTCLSGDEGKVSCSDLKSECEPQDDISETSNVDAHSAHSSTSPGPARIKPDSFWIRQATLEEDATMNDEEETESEIVSSSGLDLDSVELIDLSQQLQQPPSPGNLEENKGVETTTASPQRDQLNPTSLSLHQATTDFVVEDEKNPSLLISSLQTPSPSSSSSPSSSGAPPQVPAQCDGFSGIQFLNSSPPGSSEQSSVPHCMDTNQAPVSVDSPIDHCQRMVEPNLIGSHMDLDKSQSNDFTKPENDHQDMSYVLEEKDPVIVESSEDHVDLVQSKESAGLAHKAKLESGVRDYFFREKIPWNPGKVQKIREGIDRLGAIGDVGEEKGGPEIVCCLNDVTTEENMDSDNDKIILNELMDIEESSKKESDGVCDPVENEAVLDEGAGVLSLYEKEEIPMEPGTVLRTRNEIEERQRFSRSSEGEGELQACLTSNVSPSKPILRTSSLKTVKESQVSSLGPRRVSCGPIMEPLVPWDNVDDDDDDDDDEMMMDEDMDEECIMKSRSLDVVPGTSLDLPANLDSESSTDPMEELADQENSGIVKSFVRKLEKQPSDLKKTRSSSEVENVVICDKESKVSSSLPVTSDSDVKLDLEFVAGESSTDCLQLEMDQGSSDATESSVVRHLVGQFETKSPESSKATENFQVKDCRGDSLSNKGQMSNKIECAGGADHIEKLLTSDSKDSLFSVQLIPLFQSEDTNASCDQSPHTKTDDSLSKEERHKEIWSPYQPSSPPQPTEDIRSLRRRFESTNPSLEKSDGKQTRPKSVERMCGGFESRSQSDTNLEERSKEVNDTMLRQVSDEGRKVRRLHGKSHPLTRLSQVRGGVFHSSM